MLFRSQVELLIRRVQPVIGLPDDRLHAPNEKLDLKQLWDGIRVFGRFYELLASL